MRFGIGRIRGKTREQEQMKSSGGNFASLLTISKKLKLKIEQIDSR